MDLSTNYLGIRLRNPIIVGSAGITETARLLKQAEDAGAGGVVMKSLFEERKARSSPTPRFALIDRGTARVLYSYEQASRFDEHEYAHQLKEAKRTLSIPVIASINCTKLDTWRYYAKILEDAGADALELNVSCPHSSVTFTGREVEGRISKIAETVREAVDIPVAVKLSGQLTEPLSLAKELENIGVDGLVLFNRFTGIDFDIELEEPIMHKSFAGWGGEFSIFYPIGWMVRFYRAGLKCYLCGSGGVASGEDVVKYILAGAHAVQVCTAVVLRGYGVVKELLRGVKAFMERKGYESLEEFRGKGAEKVLGFDEVDRHKRVHAFIKRDVCTGCGLCGRICIYEAVRQEGDKFAVDADRCAGCGLCWELCPVGAIELEVHDAGGSA